MSRTAEVIELAQDADQVMKRLTRPDPTRTWVGCFSEMRPGGAVQVLIHDEEDDCYGLWMIHGGRLREVPLPHTRRPGGPDRRRRATRLRRTDCGPVDWPEEIDGGDRSRPPAG
ncbi:hypothetical protein [Streptomyces sp. NPDC001546]|uniref:hypothetical protein n=1 Tax=Streptomyces sp. NPDC001546 TaxID=3364585 RepID=UPI0036A4E63A